MVWYSTLIDVKPKITPTPVAKKRTAKSPNNEPPQEERKPGVIRDLVERASGVVTAVTRIPANFVSGVLVGGIQGARRGGNGEPTAESSAVGQVALNTVQNTVIAAATGFAVAGPVGAAINVATDSVGTGAGIYCFVKNGGAKEMGQHLNEAIEKSVKPGEGVVTGFVKGAVAGGGRGTTGAAKTGFREGKGTAAGVIDGLGETLKEFARAKAPKKNVVLAALGTGLGVVRGAMSGPTGAALSLFYKPATNEIKPSTATRLAVSAGTGAATGAAIGMLAGPVGAAVGAGVGALFNLLGPTSKQSFADKIARSVRRARRAEDDLGSEVANNNRNMMQGIIVGGLAGVRHGWDSGAELKG